MANFEELTKGMTSNEILNLYRNFYYREPDHTERGIVAWAINDILPKFVHYQKLAQEGKLVRIPCKCGDVLWGIKVYKGYLMAKQGFVREMYFTKSMALMIVLEHICRGELGKKIFRTKEEAEQAIIDLGYERSDKNPDLFKVKSIRPDEV